MCGVPLIFAKLSGHYQALSYHDSHVSSHVSSLVRSHGLIRV